MIATRILAFTLVSAAFLATVSVAHAVLRAGGSSERYPRLTLILSGADVQFPIGRSANCENFPVARNAGPDGFVRGPGGRDRSVGARGDIGKDARSAVQVMRPVLRIIPRSTVF